MVGHVAKANGSKWQAPRPMYLYSTSLLLVSSDLQRLNRPDRIWHGISSMQNPSKEKKILGDE